RLDQVVITLVSRDRGQGFDPYSLQGRRSFSTFGRTGSSLSTLGRVMAVYVSTSPYTVEDGIGTHNPWKTVLGVTLPYLTLLRLKCLRETLLRVRS
ncbi:hypothetical protein Tco_0697363, partial [Tanacetum coccineum]